MFVSVIKVSYKFKWQKIPETSLLIKEILNKSFRDFTQQVGKDLKKKMSLLLVRAPLRQAFSLLDGV